MNMVYHYIYRTVCIVSGKFYIGKHTTHTLENDYLGSGKILLASVEKHGAGKHVKQILEILPTLEELNRREVEIVDKELLRDPLCMNIVLGGSGSWHEVSRIALERGNFFTLGMLDKK